MVSERETKKVQDAATSTAGGSRNEQPLRHGPGLREVSWQVVKPSSQPPAHTEFSAQLMELMFMCNTRFGNQKIRSNCLTMPFFTRPKEVTGQQFHVFQPNSK